MLSRQTLELEMTQKQLNRHLEFARELQILSRKSEGIWAVPQIRPAEPPKPGEPGPRPQVPQTGSQIDGPSGRPDKPEAFEDIPAEAGSRIVALRNQLLEQAENLKKAHETIRMLREQKGSQSQLITEYTAPQSPAAAAVPTAEKPDGPEISWITKPSNERNTRTAVRQFLEEQETKGFKKQDKVPQEPAKPISALPAAEAPVKSEPKPQKPQQAEPDEKTKSLFRKFGLLGGWSAEKK